jgi:hypothetical protein
MMTIVLPRQEARLRLFRILNAISPGLKRFCRLLIVLNESLRMMNFEWASCNIFSIAISMAVASAVNMEHSGGSLCIIFLFGNIIENPTPS